MICMASNIITIERILQPSYISRGTLVGAIEKKRPVDHS